MPKSNPSVASGRAAGIASTISGSSLVDATVTSSFNDKNGEIEQNGEKIALRAADENITADVQATVDVTGYPGLYNSTKQLNVILQEDIAVKTAGKTQATLTFDSDAYSVNVGESLTVKATTNSSASVIYSSSDKTISMPIVP